MTIGKSVISVLVSIDCGGAATYAERGRRVTATYGTVGEGVSTGVRKHEAGLERGCRGYFYFPIINRENIVMVQYSPAFFLENIVVMRGSPAVYAEYISMHEYYPYI